MCRLFVFVTFNVTTPLPCRTVKRKLLFISVTVTVCSLSGFGHVGSVCKRSTKSRTLITMSRTIESELYRRRVLIH